ncbi:unnamed protein product, partial [Protopolystoma xenopodis]
MTVVYAPVALEYKLKAYSVKVVLNFTHLLERTPIPISPCLFVSTMLTPNDVYDTASSIGQDCQMLIDQHGPEILSSLMPKVVSILEELEECTSCFEKEQEEISRLQSVIKTLKEEKQSRIDGRNTYDKGLEQLEQSWFTETRDLLA